MTDNNHPIAPPPEIVREWQIKIEYCSKRADREAVVAKIFQLGADMELEACCEWLIDEGHEYEHIALRNARRPKPPSLKEHALEIVENLVACDHLSPRDEATLLRALESLPS